MVFELRVEKLTCYKIHVSGLWKSFWMVWGIDEDLVYCTCDIFRNERQYDCTYWKQDAMIHVDVFPTWFHNIIKIIFIWTKMVFQLRVDDPTYFKIHVSGLWKSFWMIRGIGKHLVGCTCRREVKWCYVENSLFFSS